MQVISAVENRESRVSMGVLGGEMKAFFTKEESVLLKGDTWTKTRRRDTKTEGKRMFLEGCRIRGPCG